jgi:hypothetical protein
VCSKLTQTCAPWGTAGDACDKGDNTCGYGFGCAGATNATTGTCQPLAVAGQACGRTADAVCDTGAGLFCTDGICRPATLSRTGGVCGALPGDAGADAAPHGYCMGSSQCETADAGLQGVCTGPGADNGPCDTAEERIGCMAPARCVGLTDDAGVVGTCQVLTGACP